MSLLRDSIAGQLIRRLSKGRYLNYAEQIDPALWKRYIDRDASDLENGVFVVGWWNEHDRENPQRWPLPKKIFVTFEICLLTFSVYIGSAIYTPGIPTVTQEFQISRVAATLGLTLYVAGYGVGPLLFSPASEVPQIGRNPIYIATLAVFVALQVPTALAGNLGTLLAFRFLTGLFGSPALATVFGSYLVCYIQLTEQGGASIADMYRPAKRAYAIGIWGVSAICGPVLGPLVGGFAAQANGWPWTIWELLWLSGFTLVLLFFFLPETSSANIVYRRARRLRKLTGRRELKSGPEIASEGMTAREMAMLILVRPFTLNFMEPMVFLLNLYIALIYGLLYIWFESFPIVFVQIYGFNLGQLGLAFLGILVGAFLVIPPYYWWMYKYVEPRFDEDGNISPEARLPPACVGGFFIPVCLFWFGWSAQPYIHWIMPVFGSMLFAIGTFLLFNAVLSWLPDAYPAYAASVLAGNDLFRSSFGAGFPLFATAMYHNLGVGWASSTLAFISIVFIPIPWVLMKYGGTLRKKYSRHSRKDI